MQLRGSPGAAGIPYCATRLAAGAHSIHRPDSRQLRGSPTARRARSGGPLDSPA
ncbi:hypothetical protein HMPREF0063_11839 [Aeromicrobium marinum DSM 15272]|uniref:Uncharacterized protein n=1 Tax=Aeromicrobium marinum DSM 15272 TaxID=585531 RepID=E2SDQ3_9ACTN|nr:hypothetical protein HMPREF0063_11839 [Aeromicrobium marinum DSM 15272]